jgi:hypothetical protein
MKIKFIVLTCEKYHETRLKSIKDTWGNNQDVIFLSDFNQGKEIVGFDYIPTGYNNAPMKYVELMKTYEDFSADWYFFTDDDTFVNVRNIENILSDFDVNEKICVARIGKLNPDGTDMDGDQTGFDMSTIKGEETHLPLYTISGGSGFILSRKSMIGVCDYVKDSINPPYCYKTDVTMAFWLRNSGTKIINTDRLCHNTPLKMNHTKEDFNKSVSYHYVDHNMMRVLFNESIEIKNCIITQAKDQADRIKDWVLYHHSEGFDTFIYFDDYSSDNSIDILKSLREKYGINIHIYHSDGIGSKKNREEMKNSDSYGGDISINYRIIRSYNNGLEMVRKSNPNAICALIDVDEFLITNNDEKVSDVIKRISNERNSDHILVHSFDVRDDFSLGEWYTTQEETSYRWDYESRDKGIYKSRVKSITTPIFTNEIPQGPGYVHDMRDLTREEIDKISIREYDILRIHHLRKPIMDKTIDLVKDTTLLEKMVKLRNRLN